MLEKILHNGLHPDFRRLDAQKLLLHVAVVEKLVIIEKAHQIKVLPGDGNLLFQGNYGFRLYDVAVKQP